MENTPLFTAGAIARDRLDKYVTGKLTDANAWDEEAWRFYTFLLEQAKKYRINYSAYASPEYQADKTAALGNLKSSKKENDHAPRSDNSRRGEQT